MAAVTPPSLAQIQQMRESVKNCASYRVVVDMGETVYDSLNSFLIWDDDNMLLHAIWANTMPTTQRKYPYRIDHIDYNQIEFIYSNVGK